MKEAYAEAQRNGGAVNGGPFATDILKARQAINEFLPDAGLKDNLPPQEIVQKLGFGLATALVKELTSRGTQMELAQAFKSVPGLQMSDQGAQYMADIMTQVQQQKLDLAKLATERGYDNPRQWPALRQQYYDTHPLVSPFTGSPLDASNISSDMAQAKIPTQATPVSGPGLKLPGVNIPAAPAVGPGHFDYDPTTGKFVQRQ